MVSFEPVTYSIRVYYKTTTPWKRIYYLISLVDPHYKGRYFEALRPTLPFFGCLPSRHTRGPPQSREKDFPLVRLLE
jgi:hypothetical protein